MTLFDLKTDVKELSSINDGMTRMGYDQYNATRDVTKDNFPNGSIRYKFENSSNKWWVPSKTYMRTRFKLTKANGTQLTKADNITVNMNLMPNLFQSSSFQIGDKTVSRIGDFMPQVDSLETRMYKSRAWLAGLGDSTGFWNPSFKVRQSDVVSDGVLIEDKTGSLVQGLPLNRQELGFDAAGGLAAERNQWGYVALTGVLTYSQGTDAAGLAPAQASAAFPAGSYFGFVLADSTDVNFNRIAKVVANDGAGVLTLETGVIAGDVASSGLNDFVRVLVTGDDEQNVARKKSSLSAMWQPPLSIFKVDHAIPGGSFELILNPQSSSNYKKYAIESLLGSGSKVPLTDFDFEIVDMYLYVSVVEGPRTDNISYLLDLEQTRMQPYSLTSSSFGQKNFDVSPSTTALTVAYQDDRCGSDTQVSSSKFKAYNAGLTESQELKLDRFYISYSGQQLPSPDAEMQFDSTTDHTVQRYMETMINNEAWMDTGGGESIQEFHDRGAYYHFKFKRDATDRSTRACINQSFDNSADISNVRVLLFDHSKQVARVQMQEGRIISVQLEDA